jgi:hydroxypyruvate isomerase
MPARLCSSLTLLFNEAPIQRRFEAAKRAGFEGVEIQDLSVASLKDLQRAARDADVSVVLINADTGDAGVGGPGLSGVPGRESQFIDALDKAIEAAEALSAAFVHIGPSRIVQGESAARCMAVYLDNVERALRRADGTSSKLVIEALNRKDAPDVLLGDLDVATSIVRRFGGKLGLLFDVYHTAQAGLDPTKAICGCLDVVAHIQVADTPGRHEPGSGEVDFPCFFKAIGAAGYQGWVGAEYRPSQTSFESLAWMPEARALMGGEASQ